METVGWRRARARRVGGVCVLIGLGVLAVACTARERAVSEGGTGTRAKGEEGTAPVAVAVEPAPSASALATTATTPPPPPADKSPEMKDDNQGSMGNPSTTAPQREAAEFGMIGILGGKGAGNAPAQGFGDGHGSLALGSGAHLLPRLDPNARYATTYRPGGAALAAFDAAVARGAIPASYKDLVGDFGGRYAPPIARPDDRALSFQIETERAAAPPRGGAMNLRIAMRSTDATLPRAPLSVHLVLDVSGSMEGAAIDNARRAAETLVQRLEPQDDFSMVTFSSDARVLVADGPVGPRRESILSRIHEVRADGGTNISAGLDLGYVEAHSRTIDPEAVKIVMLLSDGHANAGDSNPQSLAQRSATAFQDGIQTSSFGLGADFDASLMSTIADRGAGGYYYLADSSQIAPALGRELDARLVPAAEAVEVRVRLRPDVVPLKVFGSHELGAQEAFAVRQQEVATDRNVAMHDGIGRDRQEDTQGGMRFFMPVFARDDRHAMMITVALPPGAGERAIASVEVRYKDRLRKRNVTDEIPVRIRFAADDVASAATVNPSVVATAQAFAAGDAILSAASHVDQGDRGGASRVLAERADLLRRAADTLHVPGLADDGARLLRLARAVNGEAGRVEDLPLAVLLRGSGYGYLR